MNRGYELRVCIKVFRGATVRSRDSRRRRTKDGIELEAQRNKKQTIINIK